MSAHAAGTVVPPAWPVPLAAPAPTRGKGSACRLLALRRGAVQHGVQVIQRIWGDNTCRKEEKSVGGTALGGPRHGNITATRTGGNSSAAAWHQSHTPSPLGSLVGERWAVASRVLKLAAGMRLACTVGRQRPDPLPPLPEPPPGTAWLEPPLAPAASELSLPRARRGTAGRDCCDCSCASAATSSAATATAGGCASWTPPDSSRASGSRGTLGRRSSTCGERQETKDRVGVERCTGPAHGETESKQQQVWNSTKLPAC